MRMVEESMVVQPKLTMLQKISDTVKQVAFTSVDPVFVESAGLISHNQSYSQVESARRELIGFRLQVEGPEKHVNYFQRLLKEANLIARPVMPSPDFLL